ncbi:hypothetical protein Pmani_007488 [Petrolisthes manimaculis]|uniref:Aminotransferase class I/classII large domain-containing protein n=1 Tax=Petrolisthes manimaculis TaxID=1843537 RepID=A0AAE1Q7Q5_9EUCA|nr:hypothetical protein Pmani_007488 [Petrolisthes manimaculis]
MDYTGYMNEVAKRREPLVIRELFGLQHGAPKDVVFLTAGAPNPETFPIVSGSLKLRDGTTLELTPDKMVDCLQYGPTPGYPPLIEQLKTITETIHTPPRWKDREVLVTTGSQSGLLMALEMMLTPGQTVLVEQPCYTGVLSVVSPYNPKYLPVESDGEGLVPSSLRAALASCSPHNKPKFLYTVPTGSNPSGAVTSEDRRREVYQICRDNDLLILEDDPYFFLHYDGKTPPTSYLSLDEDGRVLRFDSVSKVVSAGLRVGWVTGPRQLVHKMNLHKGSSVISSASMSQVVVSELLRVWGLEGLARHTAQVRQFYQNKRDSMLQAADKYLTGVCEWTVPAGGMFLWLKVLGVRDTWDMVMRRGLEGKVMLVPGHAFMTDPIRPCPYLRASFSATSTPIMHQGMKNLAELIQREKELQRMKPQQG